MAKKFQVVTRSAPMRAQADPYSAFTSELLYGEIVETISHHGNYLKCRNLKDDYSGYVLKESFSDEILESTHKVIRLHSFLYGEPDYKSPSITYLTFLSSLTLTGKEENGFSEIDGGGWIWSDDLAPVSHASKNIAVTANMFSGLPYLWGGKTSRGLDCSGLVQLALQHAGYECPRDSGDQAKELDFDKIDFKDPHNPENLKKNDIVFFEGHVGIMVNDIELLNATARTMDIRTEKLVDITSDYEGGITKVLRP